ncbi:MAG: hypothetical protein HPY58_01510 [Firmicutes bacterium]|nr:hypothetical protein [Bacillota bacterium]
MVNKGELTRSFWEELLHLYDEFIQLGKTDRRTIELLEKADLLREGTRIGQEIIASFPHLDFQVVDALVKQGIRERILKELREAPE